MNFEIIFSPKSYRQIKKMRIDVKKRINEAILEIKENPFHKGRISIEFFTRLRMRKKKF